MKEEKHLLSSFQSPLTALSFQDLVAPALNMDHMGSLTPARSTRGLLCLAGLGDWGGRFPNYRLRANVTDTATYSKSQLLESAKLCKLPLKVRFVLSYIRKHTESFATCS